MSRCRSADALKWGLINEVVPDGTVVDAALALAERITVNAPLAVWASKRVAAGVDDGVITGDEAGWTRTTREMGAVLRSEDAKEGPLAFARETPAGLESQVGEEERQMKRLVFEDEHEAAAGDRAPVPRRRSARRTPRSGRAIASSTAKPTSPRASTD